jgi:DNA-binding CsgD family transcriptional regulator
MPRLSRAHEHARRRINDLAVSGLSAATLATRITATLQEAIGWDGYRLFGLDERTMLVNSLLAASENDADARLEWLREVYLAIPTNYAELPELARSGLRGVAFQERQEECWGFPTRQLSRVDPRDHYRHYHDFRSPVGGTLMAIFRDRQRPVAAMQAYRRDPNRQFRSSDVQFVQQMSTAIGQALATAAARDAAIFISEPTTTTPSGILLVESGGNIRFSTPATEQWLEALGPRDGVLPVPVWSAMAAQRMRAAGDAAMVSVMTSRGNIRVEASAAGEPGVQAVVISAEIPPASPRIPSSWGLTAREAEVVEHLAMGKANAQIAADLFVAEHTVEWHLKSVYEKLDVRSRQEVVSALFRQTLLPSIERAEVGARP